MEQDYLTCHSHFSSLLVTESETAPWYESYSLGAELPELSQKQLYENPDLVSQLFGSAYSVRLTPLARYSSSFQDVKEHRRTVREDRGRLDQHLLNKALFGALSEMDLARNLHQTLSELARKNKKSKEDIAELFIRFSGDLDALRNHLQYSRKLRASQKQFFTEWSHAEDTALFRGLESHDYQVLLKTKGTSELEKRRSFLLGGSVDFCQQNSQAEPDAQ